MYQGIVVSMLEPGEFNITVYRVGQAEEFWQHQREKMLPDGSLVAGAAWLDKPTGREEIAPLARSLYRSTNLLYWHQGTRQ